MQNNKTKVTSLMTLIKERLDIEAVVTPGKTGQFEVIADGERIAERGGTGSHEALASAIPISRVWSSRSKSAVRVTQCAKRAGLELCYCSFAYSALASFRMGMSGSASFQRAKKSW
jgi:hypothetical protein